MKKHANIPIFIPHLGCPNQCVFCNQRTISGVESFDPGSVRKIIEDSLETLCDEYECEIAFFGGSFTGIDREQMISLLQISKEYIDSGYISSVRCSTRPDYINDEILDILKKYGVKTIELGLQSCDDSVLRDSKRGHGFLDERRACEMIVERGFDLVGQMMIGLPGSTLETELATARFISSVGASAARIYPTVVFRDTELCLMAESGVYIPLTIEDAVDRSAAVYEVFLDSGVKVIRVGLCSTDNLFDKDKYYSGPNHPALGELVENRLFYYRIRRDMKSAVTDECRVYKILVPPGCLSKAIGQRKINKKRLIDEFELHDLLFAEDPDLSEFECKIVQERK